MKEIHDIHFKITDTIAEAINDARTGMEQIDPDGTYDFEMILSIRISPKEGDGEGEGSFLLIGKRSDLMQTAVHLSGMAALWEPIAASECGHEGCDLMDFSSDDIDDLNPLGGVSSN